nr:hypothetical protein [Neobacillus sp. Marseille-Q6967]
MKKMRVFKIAAIILGVIACLIGGYAYWDGLQTRVNVAEIEDKSSSEASAEIE